MNVGSALQSVVSERRLDCDCFGVYSQSGCAAVGPATISAAMCACTYLEQSSKNHVYLVDR